ncbi:MAG: hypothetical protein ACWA5U_03805, partial [bacterium]
MPAMKDAHWQLLDDLQAVKTAEERAWLVLAFNLACLPKTVADAVYCAAIPPFFSRDELTILLEQPLGNEAWERLLNLSYVERHTNKGWKIHPASRTLLQQQLQKKSPAHYHTLQQRWLVWQTLPAPSKASVYTALATNDAPLWKKTWGALFFTKPHPTLAPQVMRQNLLHIKQTLEQCCLSVQLVKREQQARERDDQQEAAIRKKGKRHKRKPPPDDNPIDQIQAAIEGVVQQLKNNKLPQAKKFLKQIIAQQKEANFIAKTLCNVAAQAQQLGYFAWAESLYNDAMRQHPEDVVAQTGLAEVYKAQGR